MKDSFHSIFQIVRAGIALPRRYSLFTILPSGSSATHEREIIPCAASFEAMAESPIQGFSGMFPKKLGILT
jgi:hypothetical protein